MAGCLRHNVYECRPVWNYHQTFEPALQAMREVAATIEVKP
jgi:hypothetical protein